MRLAIAKIKTDQRAQGRIEGLDDERVTEFGDAMLRGDTFPPIVVFHDGTDYWLADGFHRVEGASAAGLKDIEADVRPGTLRDAILHSVGANATHGTPRSKRDKRFNAEKLLADPEWREWSDRELARRVQVSHTFIATVRASMPGAGSAERRFVSRHGTEGVRHTDGNERLSLPAPGKKATSLPAGALLDGNVAMETAASWLPPRVDADMALAHEAEDALVRAVELIERAFASPRASRMLEPTMRNVAPRLARLIERATGAAA